MHLAGGCQRVGLTANAGPIVPAVHSFWNGAGSGVEVADLQRLRDVFLESRALQERGTEAELTGVQLALSRVESILAEQLSYFLDENPSVARTIVNKAVDASRARDAARKARDLARRKSALEGGELPGKLQPP